MKPTHPSYLELDRYKLGASADASVRAHVEACRRCQEHLTRIAPRDDVPDWVRTLRRTPPSPPRWQAGFAGLAIAAALALALLRTSEPPPPYVGAKGAPSALVHVQHDDVSGLWDGRALSPGDQIRLELAPEGFQHVSVFSVTTGREGATLLYQGAVTPHARVLLPPAWALDHAPAAERIAVVFSRATMSPRAAAQLLRGHDPAEASVLELVLPKRLP